MKFFNHLVARHSDDVFDLFGRELEIIAKRQNEPDFRLQPVESIKLRRPCADHLILKLRGATDADLSHVLEDTFESVPPFQEHVFFCHRFELTDEERAAAWAD